MDSLTRFGEHGGANLGVCGEYSFVDWVPADEVSGLTAGIQSRLLLLCALSCVHACILRSFDHPQFIPAKSKHNFSDCCVAKKPPAIIHADLKYKTFLFLDTSRGTAEPQERRGMLFCAVCCKPANLRCSVCGVEAYCSKACQKRIWRKHKLVCTPKTKTVENKMPVDHVTLCYGSNTPVPEDPGGDLMRMGQERTTILHRALKAKNGSHEQAENFAKFEEMTERERKEWEKRGEYAGAAKAVYMLAVGNAQMGRANKYVKYMAQTRNYLPMIHDKEEQNFLQFAIQNMESQVHRLLKTTHKLDFDISFDKPVPLSLSETQKCLPGETLHVLKKLQGITQCFVRIVQLPPGAAQHLLTKEEFAELVRPMQEDVNLSQCSRRMQVFVNNENDAEYMKQAVIALNHLSQVIKFVPAKCSKQYDTKKYLRLLLLRLGRLLMQAKKKATKLAFKVWTQKLQHGPPLPETKRAVSSAQSR